MKYVYILVSSENDLYYEQMLISVFSLRTRMPAVHVIVLCDNETEKSFCGKHGNLRNWRRKSVPCRSSLL